LKLFEITFRRRLNLKEQRKITRMQKKSAKLDRNIPKELQVKNPNGRTTDPLKLQKKIEKREQRKIQKEMRKSRNGKVGKEEKLEMKEENPVSNNMYPVQAIPMLKSTNGSIGGVVANGEVNVKPDCEGNWLEKVTHLYLDGNNMLYVCEPIRKLVLRRKIRAAENILQYLARDFTRVMNLERCVLIFDETPTSVNEKDLIVCSARPITSTSDEVLIRWAKERMGCGTDLYVTSDRDLTRQLSLAGARVMKPKSFFKFALCKLVADGGHEGDVDALMDKWLQESQIENLGQTLDSIHMNSTTA